MTLFKSHYMTALMDHDLDFCIGPEMVFHDQVICFKKFEPFMDMEARFSKMFLDMGNTTREYSFEKTINNSSRKCSSKYRVKTQGNGMMMMMSSLEREMEMKIAMMDNFISSPPSLLVPCISPLKKITMKKEWECMDGTKAETEYSWKNKKEESQSNEYSFKYSAKKPSRDCEYILKCQTSGAKKETSEPAKKVELKKEWKGIDGSKSQVTFKYEANKNSQKNNRVVGKEIEGSKDEGVSSSKALVPVAETHKIPVKEEEVREVEITDEYGEAIKKVQIAFNKAREAIIEKGKQKEISPQEAAFLIQEYFRNYMLRKSQTLRGLRELAMAKEKLKELRSLFTSYGYRRLLCRSEEEKQRFAERAIVLLLTVESIEGANYLVRESKRSMIQVLESMLDSLDPGNDSFKKRRFDLPSGPAEQEMEMEVQQVVNLTEGKSEE